MTTSTITRLTAALAVGAAVLVTSTVANASPGLGASMPSGFAHSSTFTRSATVGMRGAAKSGDITCTFYGNCKPTPCPRGKKADGTCW